jgi:tetratricopeptide (TPR) repeat protein
MRFRAPLRLSPVAALAAGLLLSASAFAEDAAPTASGGANPPVVQEVPPPTGDASPSAQGENICFTGKGSIKEVLDACAAYIASNPDDKTRLVIAHDVRAMALSATGKYDEAIGEMTAAIELDPTVPNSYFMRAAAYETVKDYDKAIADLDKAISLDATHGDFFLLRGIVYADKGDLDRALVEMNEKVKLDPDLTNGYSKRGDLHRLRKEYDESIADFTEVIKIDPQGPKGYIDRGWVYVRPRQGRPRFRHRAHPAPERSFGSRRPRPGEEPQGQAHRRQRRSFARTEDRARHLRRDQGARNRVVSSRADSWGTRA